MGKIHTQRNETALWHSLLGEAQEKTAVYLEEDLECYLVFLLIRFTQQTDMAQSVLALEFLDALQENRKIKQEALRDVGDKCLLFSGLFPEHAHRKKVEMNYFVSLGRNAYSNIIDSTNPLSCIFNKLTHQFILLTDVLNNSRDVSSNYPSENFNKNLELLKQIDPEYVQQKFNGKINLPGNDGVVH